MSVCAAKVRNALAEKGIPWGGVHLDLRAGDAQRPEYVKLNPNQVVPLLVHEGAVTLGLKSLGDFANVASMVWRSFLARGRISAQGTHSTLQGFQRVGSNFLPLGTPH
jgi:hypothetical protein